MKKLLIALLVIVVIVGVGFASYKFGETIGKEAGQAMEEKNAANDTNNENNNVNTIENEANNENSIVNEVNNKNEVDNSNSEKKYNLDKGKYYAAFYYATMEGENNPEGYTMPIYSYYTIELKKNNEFTTIGGIDNRFAGQGTFGRGTYKIDNNELILNYEETGIPGEPETNEENKRVEKYTITDNNKFGDNDGVYVIEKIF